MFQGHRFFCDKNKNPHTNFWYNLLISGGVKGEAASLSRKLISQIVVEIGVGVNLLSFYFLKYPCHAEQGDDHERHETQKNGKLHFPLFFFLLGSPLAFRAIMRFWLFHRFLLMINH